MTQTDDRQQIADNIARLERIARAQLDEPQDSQVAERIAAQGKRTDKD